MGVSESSDPVRKGFVIISMPAIGKERILFLPVVLGQVERLQPALKKELDRQIGMANEKWG
jgi:hypothetical protein